MTLRIYRSTDTGAPTRGALTGAPVNMLRQILRACLVDGYGSKPAAGWSIVDEGSGGFSITNGPATGIINFWMPVVSNWYYPIVIYLAESFTGSTNGKITGDNLRSGPWSVANPVSARHLIFPSYGPFATELGSIHWTLIADERTAIFLLNSRVAASADRNSDLFLYMGEIDSPLSGPARFVVSGGSNSYAETDNINNFSAAAFGPFGRGYTALRNLNTGLIQPGLIELYPVELTLAGGSFTPDMPADCMFGNRLTFAQAKIYTGTAAGNGFAGFFRGVLIEPSLIYWSWLTAMSVLGLPRADDSAGTFVGPPGDAVALFCGRGVNTFFVTDNPAYW